MVRQHPIIDLFFVMFLIHVLSDLVGGSVVASSRRCERFDHSDVITSHRRILVITVSVHDNGPACVPTDTRVVNRILRPIEKEAPRRPSLTRRHTRDVSYNGPTPWVKPGGSSDIMSRKDIVFVTGNAKKLEEVIQMFKTFYNDTTVPFNLVNKNVDLPEYQGKRDEICVSKACAAYEIINGPCIVEDTSLCFNAMGGLPGPYVKWFLEALGPSGLNRMLHGFEDKTAMAVCTVAYVDKEGSVSLFSGETHGEIVEPTVAETFGWDSCFKPEGYNITYSQMPKEKKNLISHRMKAMLKLKEHLDKIESK